MITQKYARENNIPELLIGSFVVVFVSDRYWNDHHDIDNHNDKELAYVLAELGINGHESENEYFVNSAQLNEISNGPRFSQNWDFSDFVAKRNAVHRGAVDEKEDCGFSVQQADTHDEGKWFRDIATASDFQEKMQNFSWNKDKNNIIIIDLNTDKVVKPIDSSTMRYKLIMRAEARSIEYKKWQSPSHEIGRANTRVEASRLLNGFIKDAFEIIQAKGLSGPFRAEAPELKNAKIIVELKIVIISDDENLDNTSIRQEFFIDTPMRNQSSTSLTGVQKESQFHGEIPYEGDGDLSDGVDQMFQQLLHENAEHFVIKEIDKSGDVVIPSEKSLDGIFTSKAEAWSFLEKEITAKPYLNKSYFMVMGSRSGLHANPNIKPQNVPLIPQKWYAYIDIHNKKHLAQYIKTHADATDSYMVFTDCDSEFSKTDYSINTKWIKTIDLMYPEFIDNDLMAAWKIYRSLNLGKQAISKGVSLMNHPTLPNSPAVSTFTIEQVADCFKDWLKNTYGTKDIYNQNKATVDAYILSALRETAVKDEQPESDLAPDEFNIVQDEQRGVRIQPQEEFRIEINTPSGWVSTTQMDGLEPLSNHGSWRSARDSLDAFLAESPGYAREDFRIVHMYR